MVSQTFKVVCMCLCVCAHQRVNGGHCSFLNGGYIWWLITAQRIDDGTFQWVQG